MSTAGELVTRARDAHPAFTRDHTPDATALRLLARSRDALYALALRYHRAAFVVTTTLPWNPAALTPEGLDIGGSHFVDVVRVRFTDGWTVPLVRVEREPVQRPPYGGQCVRLVGADQSRVQLYPQATEAWANVAALEIDRVPTLPPLATLADDVGLIRLADDALVGATVSRMAMRGLPAGTTLPPLPQRRFDEDAAAAMRVFFDHLAEQRRTASFQVTEGL